MFRRLLKYQVLLLVFVALLWTVHAAPQNSTGGKPKEIDILGSVSGHIYSNHVLGFSYEFPKGWSVDTAAMHYRNFEMNARSDQDGNREDAPWLRLPKKDHILLQVSEKNATTTRVAPPYVLLSASELKEGDDGRKITSFMQSLVTDSAVRSGGETLAQPSTTIFGGHEFSRLDVRKPIPKHGVTYRSYLATTRNHYFLTFEIVATSKKEMQEIISTMSSVRFDGQN